MQPSCVPIPEGITNECKAALKKFVTEGPSSGRIDRGWLVCLISSPPVIVAATARSQDAVNDVRLLRSCLPIGLEVCGCWQLHDGGDVLDESTRTWKESGASGAGMHLGVSAVGELATDIPVLPCPETRVLNITFSFACAAAVQGGAPATFLLGDGSAGELVQPGKLLLSELSVPKDGPLAHPIVLTLVSCVTIPLSVPRPSPVLIRAGDAAKYSSQLLQHLHTIAAHVPPTMPLATLAQLVVAQATAASASALQSRHEFLQFKLPGWVYRVNICIPEAPSVNSAVEGDEDEEIVVVKRQDDKEMHWLPQRLQLHALFGLPATRPVFRTILSINESAAVGTNGKLVNVHTALVPPNIQGANICVVYGSLQSVWSWFQLQGYTSRPPPSILEIQKFVVETGFRTKSLIGTKDWIGSIEVGAVLDQQLEGCSHKILNLSSGHELDSHARDLVAHFMSVGTPITTGGGELAHTMLGICANLDTGETRYLILDPHYTGVDDEKSVVKGKGCQWVKQDFFDRKSFLNLCLPQPPQEQ